MEKTLSKFTRIYMVYTTLIARTYFHCMNHPVWCHGLKLAKRSSRTQLRQNFFSNGVVKLWNNLPEDVAMAPTVNCFKGRFDRHSAVNRYSMEWKYGPAKNAE